MRLSFSKNIKPIRLLLGVCSFVHLFVIFVYGSAFLQGTLLPVELALKFKEPNLLSLLPKPGLILMPYFWTDGHQFALLTHVLVLIMFSFHWKPKITTPILFIFEYCLLMRMGLLGHAGNILFLTALIIFIFEDWLSENKKWVACALWVSQFACVYLFSGLNKSLKLWLIQGTALQSFVDIERANTGLSPLQLGSFGILLSRLVIPVEIVSSMAIIIIFLFPSHNGRKLLFIPLTALGLIHVGSFIFFDLFTFPFMGLIFLLGIYLSFSRVKNHSLKMKASIFFVVLLTHLLPFSGLKIYPLSFIPLKNHWTLFSKPAKVIAGEVSISVIKAGEIIYTTKLNESFHWTRFRFLIDNGFPYYLESRSGLDAYLCREFSAEEIKWETPTDIRLKHCAAIND